MPPVPDTRYPADPYPGAVPPFPYLHVDGQTHPLPAATGPTDPALEALLARYGATPLARRVPVLAYGSNRNPSKITWLREALGLGPDPVVVLPVRTEGLAAVWAAGLRARDGSRPVVLAAAPGATEEHALWLATSEQVAVLDRCEGRGRRHRLARLRSGAVRTRDGGVVSEPWCYLGSAPQRRPLLVANAPVRCADRPEPAGLEGVPAEDDGLDARTEPGPPDPDAWPAALFVYGLLRPDQPSWPLLAPHVDGTPRAARVPGTVHDTGRGFPALLPGPGTAPGVLVAVRDPAAFRHLDRYEGPDYRRVRTRTTDGATCWVYLWRSTDIGFTPLPEGWFPRGS